jgi:hypothetical protein
MYGGMMKPEATGKVHARGVIESMATGYTFTKALP